MSDKYVRIHLQSEDASKNAKSLDRDINDLDSSTKLLNASFNKLAAAIAGVIAGQQLISFFKDSITVSANFSAAMARVGAIARATDSQLVTLTETAREFGASTEFSATQAASGLQFLSQAGFQVEESVNALPGLLDLATVSALDLGSAADIASNIMSGFGIEAENTSGVVDVLAATSSRANTDVAQLGDAMSFVAPVASSFGIAIEEVSAGVGALSNAGIQGQRAGTGLRTVLASLANPTGKATKALKSLGLTTEQINPQTNSLTEIMSVLAESGIQASEAFELVGTEGAPALLALIEQRGELRELSETLRDVEGEAKEMAETFRDTLTGDVKTLQSAYQDLQITLGDMFTDDARESVQSLTEATRFITENLDGILDVVEVLTIAVGVKLATALGASAVAFTRQAASSLKATTTMNALGQVTNRTTVAMNAATVAARTARTAITALAGPAGILITAVAIFQTYNQDLEETAEKTKEAYEATDILTKSVEGLTQAQAKVERREAERALEAQTEKVEELAMHTRDLQQLVDAVGAGAEIEVFGESMIAGEALQRANEDLGLAQENLLKIATRYREIDRIAKDIQIGGDGDEVEEPSVDSPTGDGDASNRTVERLQSTTDTMRRELEKRRALRELHGSMSLNQIDDQITQEKQMLELQRQEDLINEDARFVEEKARRDQRFQELLTDDQIKREERAAIEQQWKTQTEIAEEIHQENLTRIDQEAANARQQIMDQELAYRLQQTQQSGQTIMSVFQGQSKKMFEIGKGLALASTVAGLPAAVEKAWENGGGYPWGIATAAARLAIGVSNISKIKGTKFNTKSGSASASGGGGSPVSSSPQPSPTETSSPELNIPRQEQVDAIDFGPVVDELRNQDGAVSTEFVARILESAQEATRLTGRTEA